MSVPVQNPINQVPIVGGETLIPWTWNLQQQSEITECHFEKHLFQFYAETLFFTSPSIHLTCSHLVTIIRNCDDQTGHCHYCCMLRCPFQIYLPERC